MNSFPSSSSEKGNVLFLILIAVALFAALSYAVTSSSRTGGGDASAEVNKTNIAALQQFAPTLRTGIIRMTVSRGIPLSDIDFNEPDVFSTLPADAMAHNVFNPQVGGVIYSQVPRPLKDPAYIGSQWIITSNNEVKGIGSTSSGPGADIASVDVVAFAPGLTRDACEQINKSIGVTGVPVQSSVDYINIHGYGQGFMGAGGGGIIGGEAGSASLANHDQGCFDYGGDYVYYAVVAER